VRFKTLGCTWEVAEDFEGYSGPGAIRSVYGPKGGCLVQDDPSVWTLNDPRSGGLFAVGLVVAVPQKHETFWQWGWEATGRYADKGGGFGVRDFSCQATSDSSCTTVATYAILDKPLCTVTRRFSFDAGDLRGGFRDIAHCDITIECHDFPEAFVKEPKIVASSIRGGRFVQCADSKGKALERPYDTWHLHDPAVHTHQMPYPERRRVRVSTGIAGWVFDCDNGLDAWRKDADAETETLAGILPTPPYCLRPDGGLIARWEVPHGDGDRRIGVFFHAWEGGYGAPDCGGAYRPWPSGKVYSSHVSAERLPKLSLEP
jgi:hypothetical protein